MSSRSLIGMLAVLAVLALVAGQVEPESELDCYDGGRPSRALSDLTSFRANAPLVCLFISHSHTHSLSGWAIYPILVPTIASTMKTEHCAHYPAGLIASTAMKYLTLAGGHRPIRERAFGWMRGRLSVIRVSG